MDFDEYRLEIHRLCHDYLKLWQESGGHFPDRLPATWRPYYEKFELIVEVTGSSENISREIEKFRAHILARRAEILHALESSFTRNAVVSNPPTRANKKKETPEVVIRKADLALAAYRQKDGTRLSIASAVFGFKNTHSEQESKSAERQVRQYLSHAEMLLEAAGNGTFFEAVETPLPKK